MNSKFELLISIYFLSSLNGVALDDSKYSQLAVDEKFRKMLSSMSVQMETGGTRVFSKEDGTIWIVSIGVTVARPDSGEELLRRRTVAKMKAQASAVAELNGETVTAVSILKEKTVVETVDGVESGFTEETLEESIVTEATGLIKGMPVVGTWLSQDGSFYFLAIGRKIK